MRIILLLVPLFASAGEINGALLHGGDLFTWGREVRQWNTRSLKSRVLVAQSAARGEGGCVFLPPGHGWGLVLEEDSKLVLRRAPRFEPEVIDNAIEMHDCAQADLYGERLLIVFHKASQVRLYRQEGKRWSYREAYSIYTPSHEGGLLFTDFALIAGNYWLRIPPELDRAWREFAINTWSETPDSAMLRWARPGPGTELIAAQGHMTPGRLSRFTPPADPTQLWNEQRLAGDLRNPHALAADGPRIVAGENAGPGSRLLLYSGTPFPETLATGEGWHSAFFLSGDVVLAVGANSVDRFELNGPAGTRPRRSSSLREAERTGR